MARCLIELSGVPPEKIHVIYPAAVARGQQASDGRAECVSVTPPAGPCCVLAESVVCSASTVREST